ncbi:DUF4105 domain-containing protein [Providencia burhodogranariea]|uniref:Lnb N-terminal periplasmic domain-containing protein n=1 Tax=Providencia burhodogranariea DSM 19968 TaxID=1141662 RepID=K8WMK0_9GAMM|nr:DUF4105 domain-containing protein [Providencia burhodogranariea]EKT61784.1 hypothetical protein OOA_10168 [Providencia burhodogranariea DSM 19968]
MNQNNFWVDEYSHKPYVKFNETHSEVKIFNFRTFSSVNENHYIWDEREYKLSDLISVDLAQSHWSGDMIAHVFLSFGFANGQYISISIETRRRKEQKYSMWKGFFYNYDIIYIVADEIDLIGTRVNIRNEDVYLFPLNLDKDLIELLFVNYLGSVNEINKHDTKYHTLWNNCTTNIFKIAKKTYPNLKFDWKIMVSGYAFKYCFQQGFIDQKYISNKIKLPIIDINDQLFSVKIREQLN